MKLPICLSFEEGQWKVWHQRERYAQLILFGGYPTLEEAMKVIEKETGKTPFLQAAFAMGMERIDPAPSRVITRVMSDGVETKDGAA